MTRRLLLTFALLATSTPLAAQQLGGSAGATPEQPTLAALITAAEPPAIAMPKQTTAEAGASSAAYDVAYQLDPSPAANKAAAGFHPICDCGCTVECLDNWCICDQPCCTTDQWCQHPCQCSHGNCYLTPDGCWVSNDQECDVWGYPDDAYNTAFRLGGWGVATQGSLNKIGEYQDLHSSPFWDLDGISSSGLRTLDFTLSGLDNEANYANVYYVSGKFLWLAKGVDCTTWVRRCSMLGDYQGVERWMRRYPRWIVLRCERSCCQNLNERWMRSWTQSTAPRQVA